MSLLKRSLPVFILLSTVMASCTKLEVLTEKEVVAAINQFDRGWEQKQMAAVDSALGSKYIYFTQSGGLFSRDSVVATAAESGYTLQTVSRGDIDIHITGNTAVVSTRWRGKGTYRGTPFDEDQRCSIYIAKVNGKVRILSEHCTPIKSNIIFH